MGVTPRILIFAGPNGAGKTTFARELRTLSGTGHARLIPQ